MKKPLILLILSIITIKANNNNSITSNLSIIKELILIKNTYEWCSDKSVRFDMIIRQNKIVNKHNKHLYKNYLIRVEE